MNLLFYENNNIPLHLAEEPVLAVLEFVAARCKEQLDTIFTTVPKSSSDDLTLQRFRPAIAPESDQWPRQYSASGVALSGFIWCHRAGKRGGPPRSTRR
ncbi:hypothetical protein HPB49_015005 [Dermacentor silvarum]|uniref:Uncharacterized protein n=1 Tax=Dermacentor silvarum TaxID=543639 RepID=A0ACB8CY11_DERSI|nr:hypothetical protein HPB49_015005 [Dermacentor silvarum]